MFEKFLCLTLLVIHPFICVSKEITIPVDKIGRNASLVMKFEVAKPMVYLYDGGRLLQQYSNLVRNGETLNAGLVAVAGGGAAVEINSEGSRRKYHIIVPIELSERTLSTDCIIKSVYDAVDESHAVGMVCKRVPLDKFDVDSVINDEGLKTYISSNLASSDRRGHCHSLASLEVSQNTVESCAFDDPSGQRNMTVQILDGTRRRLFSVVGFEFIPSSGDQFSLISLHSDSLVVLRGRLSCFSKERPGLGETSLGQALLGGRYPITYSFKSNQLCLRGSYTYASARGSLDLVGSKFGKSDYLFELASDAAVTGAFELTSIQPQLSGTWISVPPKRSLDVR